MKDITKEVLAVSFKAKVSTGAFENSDVFFSAEREYSRQLTSEERESEQQDMFDGCHGNVKVVEKQLQQERLQKEMKDMRLYEVGKNKFPSVTTVIGCANPTNWHMPDHELNQYAARGTIKHSQVEKYITSGTWFEPNEIAECHKYLKQLKEGNLNLEINGDFLNFEKSYAMEYDETEKVVSNKEYEYAGRLDFTGKPLESKEWDKIGVEYVDTLFDIKSSADATSNFKQMAAYAMADGMEHIKQLCVIVLNDNKCGYAKPLVTRAIDKYFAMFLQDRGEFRKTYGI